MSNAGSSPIGSGEVGDGDGQAAESRNGTQGETAAVNEDAAGISHPDVLDVSADDLALFSTNNQNSAPIYLQNSADDDDDDDDDDGDEGLPPDWQIIPTDDPSEGNVTYQKQ